MRAYDVEASLQVPLFTARKANKKALHGAALFLQARFKVESRPTQGPFGLRSRAPHCAA
jgi:hypothetical protein